MIHSQYQVTNHLKAIFERPGITVTMLCTWLLLVVHLAFEPGGNAGYKSTWLLLVSYRFQDLPTLQVISPHAVSSARRGPVAQSQPSGSNQMQRELVTVFLQDVILDGNTLHDLLMMSSSESFAKVVGRLSSQSDVDFVHAVFRAMYKGSYTIF